MRREGEDTQDRGKGDKRRCKIIGRKGCNVIITKEGRGYKLIEIEETRIKDNKGGRRYPR